MCRNCGSIVGGGQQQCAVCGASITGGSTGQKSRAADGETIRFARAVLNRPYKFTIVLLVVNVFLFFLMLQASDAPFSLLAPLPNEVLVRFGAKLNQLIHTQHQWWRFVTPMFLHVNLLHLLVNMYSLWIVGPYVERLYGSAKFVFFWVATGVAGVVASYLTVRPNLGGGALARFIFKAYDTPSAGASGALFGLVGVLFVFGIKFRHELPEGFKRAFGTGLLPMILMNLFIGYTLRGFIDNAAHLGGMIAGAGLALVIDYRRPGENSRPAIAWKVLQVMALVLVAGSFIKAMQHFRDPLPVSVALQQPAPAEPQPPAFPDYLYYAKAINDAQEAFVVARKDGNPVNIDGAIKNLDAAPNLDDEANQLKEKLKTLLVKVKEFASTAPGTQTTKAGELDLEFVTWRKEYNQWLKTGARKHSGLNELIETK